MKVIANYLPQFYETEINNRHFGKGYTEWTAVKNSKRFFDAHSQPQVPLNDNYYSLLDSESIRWQATLAREYGVDGFAFYHYYFQANKTELDKPAEILLSHKDIDIEFFFIWANESWGRKSKNNKSRNQWTNIFDTRTGADVFVEQKYDGEVQYRCHYEYIRKFIVDRRYIYIDGKPVFGIYNGENSMAIGDMMKHWEEWAKEDGLNGFYFLGVNNWDCSVKYDAILYQTPNASYKYGVPTIEMRNGVSVKLYYEVMDRLLRIEDNRKCFWGTFVGFDNTPRYGNNHSLLIEKKNDEFEYYYRMTLKKNAKHCNDFVFVNAWNEWGEGNHLEPDVKERYKNLEAILRAKKGMDCDISIIIPAYNVQEYISDCLDSILAQCNHNIKYEIIVINDGSTDGTLDSVRKYQYKYPQIITIINSEHKGVSYARNIGLDIALGEHIYYIDADDYVENSLFVNFKKILDKGTDFDVCFFSFKNVCNDENLKMKYENMFLGEKRKCQFLEAVCGDKAFIQMWSVREYYPLVWLQLTKRDFLEQNNIRFNDEIIFEDQLYTFYVLTNAKRVICVNQEIYCKRVRKNSICTSDKGFDYLKSYLQIYYEISEFLIKKNEIVQYHELLDTFFVRIQRFYMSLSIADKNDYKNKLSIELIKILEKNNV